MKLTFQPALLWGEVLKLLFPKSFALCLSSWRRSRRCSGALADFSNHIRSRALAQWQEGKRKGSCGEMKSSFVHGQRGWLDESLPAERVTPGQHLSERLQNS